MLTSDCFLMCPPEYFDVTYVINPWMQGNINGTCPRRAHRQWQQLHDIISEQAAVELLTPQISLPDMPFTANGGLILEDKVVLSGFRYPERQREEQYFEDWFANNRYAVYKLPPQVWFEGAGDALLDRQQHLLWLGYGHRSSLESCSYLSKWLDIEVLPLRLIDKSFYHLDTCFCPLGRGYLLYYPGAFDEQSRRLIAQRVDVEKRIIINEEDALNFACNAVNIGDTVILNQTSPELCEQLEGAEFEVVQTDLSEFMKAGGAAKCLTLKLNEPRLCHRLATSEVAQEQTLFIEDSATTTTCHA